MINIGIVGATGYTGIELLRILQLHPQVKITYAGTESYVGQPLANVYPHLKNHSDLYGEKIDAAQIASRCELAFLCLPHGHAAKITEELLAAGVRVIDLGADFRLKNPDDYTKWYHNTPAPSALLEQAVYGLPEAGNTEAIASARLIANPGCYATACILSALPLLKLGMIDLHEIIFDAKSGVSGAGRSLALTSHFCEATENIKPYQVAGLHRHTPEIEQMLSHIAQENICIQFTPHLVPMIRGLLVTAYFKLTTQVSPEEIRQHYQNYYKNKPFIRLYAADEMPQTKNTLGTNYCDLNVFVDPRTQRVIVISAIDNLVKGAAGQAVQNFNLLSGLPETTGLTSLISLYP